MITRPIIKPNYHVHFIPNEGVFLIGENRRFVLEGANLLSVISLIDGIRTTTEIVEILKNHIPVQEIYSEFALLEREGHIIEYNPHIPLPFQAFWSELNVDTHLLPSILSNARIQVI